MKAKIETYPVKHIIIEDFLTKEDLDMCMDELQNIQQAFHEGTYFTQERGAHVDHRMKKCLNLDPYMYYHGIEKQSFMVSEILRKRLWTNEMRELYDSAGTDSVFSYINETDLDYALIAAFRDGDHYNWHKDLGVTTAVIMISDPEKAGFSGGEFSLSNRIGGDRPTDRYLGEEGVSSEKREFVTYEFVPGRLILFPARYEHRVTKVNVNSDSFKDMRFTLQSRSYVTNF